ncbi:acyl-CoA thioesterase [Haladaptatus caseinilyticus]|uniref:acyl-CoA thioesterase n=1 Tax=Haladaptatus caseinilyticus TaxID=2993314 RepID=UPI00224B0278|nr:thioesterase family protein [Haladaptatus caseinilyticus]
MDHFGYTTEIETRYRDFDTMGHVNNAVYATYLEQARLRYFRDVVDIPMDDISGVVAHLEIDYRRSISLEEEVTVAMRVSELGESSITMVHEIRAGDDVAATAEVVQVSIDPESGEPRPIPATWRDRIETHRGC